MGCALQGRYRLHPQPPRNYGYYAASRGPNSICRQGLARMKLRWTASHLAWAVFGLAIAARLLFFWFSEPWTAEAQSSHLLVKDAGVYHEVALEFLSGEGLSEKAIRRTPGYPLFLAATYSVVGAQPWVALLLQAFLSGCIALVIIELGATLVSRAAGLAAGALFAIEPHAIFYSNTLLTDVPFTLCFLTSALLVLRGNSASSIGWYLGAGLLLGYAILIRPVGQFLLLPFALIILVSLWREPVKALRGIAVVSLALLVVVGPWLARNYTVYGHVALSDKGGQHLLTSVAAYVVAAREGAQGRKLIVEGFNEELARRGFNDLTNPFERSAMQGQLAREVILADVPGFVVVEVIGIRNTFLNLGTSAISKFLGGERTELSKNWLNTSNSIGDHVAAFLREKTPLEMAIGAYIATVLAAVYALAAYGLIKMVRAECWYTLFVIALLIGYFLPFIGPIGIGRYKFPFMAFYLLPAGLAVSDWYRQRYSQQQLADSGEVGA